MLSGRHPAEIHENHEMYSQTSARTPRVRRRTLQWRQANAVSGGFALVYSNHQETHMTWTTPQAADMRFGFEITMYVAAR